MNETPTQKPAPPRASASAGPIIATFNRVVQLIPRKARLAVFTGLLVLVGLAFTHPFWAVLPLSI